ncbi:MAG TPA: KpsF/GutQ family sugar-phosphate isomerase [Bryobacteraceae bacterium]
MTDELALAQKAMEISGSSILRAALRLSDSFRESVRVIASHPGKIAITGVGKSGRIAEKLAATFSGTGTPALFLHAGEALHGDSGVVAPSDPVIAVSKSGNSPELLRLVQILARTSPVIAIVGDPKSALARASTYVLDAAVETESDPFNLVPSASSSVALALGHALAIAVMMKKGFDPRQFGERHPDGDLGRLLTCTVGEAMIPCAEVARVAPSSALREVLIEMTKWPTGAACVVNSEGTLAGLITDGDIRRCLERFSDIRTVSASDVMTHRPTVVNPDATLFTAARLMENGPRQLSVLPVVEGSGRLIGVLRLHDVIRAEIVLASSKLPAATP